MRKLSFLLTILIITIDIYAQQPTQEWVARIPGPYNDLAGPFLQVDKQGNSYVAGTHVINDSINILCVKYNTSGIQLWSTLYKYPGEGYFTPRGLALDSSSNAYIISDYSQSYVLPYNALIVKFNSSNGSPVWAKRYVGEYGWAAFRDIKIDRLNNIYAAGWTDTSHLVIKYNTDGDSLWVRKYHPPSVREVVRACTIDDSLNIIFTGQRMHFYPPFGTSDSLLAAKYSSGGVLRWESVFAYNPLGSDIGIKITADQNGNQYIGGVTTVSGYGVYLTLKYDRNGNRQWTTIYDAPGSGSNTIYGIVIDRINNALFVTGMVSVGNVYATTIKYNIFTGDSIWVRKGIGGFSNSGSWAVEIDRNGSTYIVGATTIGSNPADVMTLKYSTDGNQTWLINYNGPFDGSDGGRALGLDTLNNVYVLGYSQSSSQTSDYVVIKYSQLVAIQIFSNVLPNIFKLEQNYPNPFNPSSKIRFSVPKKSFITLKVFDVLGKIKEIPVNGEMNPSEYELIINASNYSSGVYFYQMTVDGKILDTKKFIVLK